MNSRFRMVFAWILCGALASIVPLFAQAQYYKTYFFKPGSIKQIVVYAHDAQNGFIMNIYTDPPVEGKGILTFATPTLGVEERHHSYYYLSQIAAMIRSGAITGVAYAPEKELLEVNPSPYFFSEIMPPGKDGGYLAYRIRGFYSLPWSATSQAAKPVAMQIQQAAVIPAGPSLAGDWKGFQGMTFTFTQNGSQFAWSVKATGEKAQGSINGDMLLVAWTNAQGSGTAKGKITAKDASGRATRIDWDNGVVFSR
ncbi:MAG: hypothetical protein MUC72_10440 [Acidobacteria bacterium]|nr:hypothetical protein [Acidobacteriota bacterium]